jgi:hypothetical protein
LDITTRAGLLACKKPVFTNMTARGDANALIVGIAIITFEDLEAADLILDKLD